MEIQGKNGSTSHSIQTNRNGILLNNNSAAKWQECNFGGNVYSTGMTSTSISNVTFTTGTLGATCTPIIGVWNPPNSGKKLVILEARLSCCLTALDSTGGAPFVWATSIGNNSISTGLSPLNRSTLNTTGSVAKGYANTALTGLTNNLSIREASILSGGSVINASFLQTPAGAVTWQNGSIEFIDGAIIVPEGGVLALLATTTPVALNASSSLIWLEIDN